MSDKLAGIRVAVLMGGTSAEREISLLTGEAVASALGELGCNVREVVVEEDCPGNVDAENTDVAFIALHGGSGEDGTVQACLQKRGVAYTGSGPDAAKLAMNKVSAKEAFGDSGIATPESCAIDPDNAEGSALDAARELGYPLVVKPTCEGSTLGVGIVNAQDELYDAVEAALAYGEGAFAEAYVEGRELTVGILGEKALPVVEILPARKFYDFAAKYRDDETSYRTDLELPGHVYEEIAGAAESAHCALGCRDVSRVDLRLNRDMEPFILEVNAVPGMTRKSLLPKAAEAAGVDYPELISRIVTMALERAGK